MDESLLGLPEICVKNKLSCVFNLNHKLYRGSVGMALAYPLRQKMSFVRETDECWIETENNP